MPHQPKLAILTPYYPPVLGGAENQLELLAHNLAGSGVQVDVFTSRLEGVKRAAIGGVSLVECSAAFEKNSSWPSDLSNQLLINGNYEAAIILLSSVHPSAVVSAAKILVQRGAKVLIRLSSEGRFDALDGTERQSLSSLPVKFIVHSSSAKFNLAEKGVEIEKICTIPNAVHSRFLETGLPRRYSKRGNRRILYAGRFDPKKRLDGLIQAWRLIEGQYPAAELRIVGSGVWEHWKGRPSVWQGLVELIRILKLKRVFVADSKEPPEMVNEYNLSDVVINPSGNEGMSNLILEGMAMRLPIICSDIPANDFVHEGRGGWKFPSESMVAISRVLSQAQSAPVNILAQFGAWNRRWIEEHISINLVLKTYREVLGW